MAEPRETSVDDVVLPVELCTLTTRSFKRRDGGAVEVRVEYASEELVFDATAGKIVPGASPELGAPEAPETKRERQARVLAALAPALLPLTCVLLRADGSEVRPAFWWGDDPKTGALPGRMLSFPDKLRLVVTSLKVCGFVGGPADSVTFPDEGRSGGDAGAPPVDTGAGDGPAPVRADAGEEAGAGTPAAAGAGV